MLKPRLYIKGLSGLLSPGKEKKGKENESNGKAHPVKATHFDYITKPSSNSNGRGSQERPRASKQHQPQGQGYSRGRQDRPSRDDRRYHHSARDNRNGSSSSSMHHHHYRPDTERRYSREDDEELMRIHNQRQNFDGRGERRSGSLPSHYSQDSRGKNRRGSLPGHYSQGSPTNPNLRGPPKPPRRQESLNRVHIPEGPDTDFTTSTSDYEIYSPSSGSSSPKNWKVSPLSPQSSSTSKHMRDRSWSPTKEYSRSPAKNQRSPDRKQKHFDNEQYDPSDPYSKRDRSPDRKQKYNDSQQYESSGDSYGHRDRSPDRRQKYSAGQQYERSGDSFSHRDRSPDRRQRYSDSQQYERSGDSYGHRDLSPDRRQKHYNNQQDQHSDHYGKRDMSAERQDWRYPRSPQPVGNGYQRDNKIDDPYRHDTGPSQYSHSPSPPDQYSLERSPSAYAQDYKQRLYSQQQNQKLNADPYGNSWIKEKSSDQSRPSSNARPLVLPQGDKVPEAPRPIYRSDGEIDLREPMYKKSREPDMFAIHQAPPAHSYPSSPISKPDATNFNYYPEPESREWEEQNQQVGQNQLKQSNSLRTVRGVKAYDQHVKKFKRPTSLGGVPRQPLNTFHQERPRSAIDRRASDDGLYPNLEHSKNSAFGVAAGSSEHPRSDSFYNNQSGISTTNNSLQYAEPQRQTGHTNGAYSITNRQNSQPEMYNDKFDSNRESSLVPKDWPKDYPAHIAVRSPAPSDTENSLSSVKQVDSGKQTIFCLVSQVVPASPSPEASPGPMQREFVEIENGKVSPVMKQPVNMPKPSQNQYSQSTVQNGYSHHGSYSPVRSQMEYQANQRDPIWKQNLQKQGGRPSGRLSEESSAGIDSDFYSRQKLPPAGYTHHAPKTASSQLPQKRDAVNQRESYRGASLSSGYHSSPEFEREQGHPAHYDQKIFYDRERFSDTEYRIGGTGKENEEDVVPTVPVKDLIKKINRDVETNGGLDLVVRRPASGDLKTILVKDAQQSNQPIKDDTCYGQRIVRRDSKSTETQTQTRDVTGMVHPNAYYNEKYITATALPCEVIDSAEEKKRKSNVHTRPLSAELPITTNIYREVESRPDIKQETPEQSEEEDKPINAKERKAFFESLTPLSKEEEIQSVVRNKKNLTEKPVSNSQQRAASQPNAMYGSIKWPNDHPAIEPSVSKQVTKQNFAEPVKVQKSKRSPSPVRQSEVYSDDDQPKSGERQAYYDRLRQRGQGKDQGLKGRRSQSLPRLNTRDKDERLEKSNGTSGSVELSNGDSSAKRRSMGAQLFQQKKLEMERHDKKQEILDKVKSQLNMKRAGSEPNLSKKDNNSDAISSLEQNRHLLSTHVAGKRIRGRDSADFEYALNQLQTIHTEADQDADDILYPQYYRPFDHRAAEIPLLAQKVAELQELLGVHASPGSGKNRKKGKRATSDVSEMIPNLYEPSNGELQEKPGKAKKGQDFFPYRQATHPKKMTKKDEFNQCGHESTSDEDKTPRPAPPGTNTKLYRHPKSSENLGFSSDSSPERPVKVKAKMVAPEHVRMASPDMSASREQRKATRNAFSGEHQDSQPSLLPSKPSKKTNSHHHPANLPPPVMQSVKFTESPKVKRAVLTKPPLAPALTKFKESQVHLQPPGCRDSISTVDSAALAQPFEDMTEEYQNMMMDHQALEIAMPDDPERTSSVESLMHLVSGSYGQQNSATPGTKLDSSYSPYGNIPLADEEEYGSSGDEGDLEDLEVPDPSELKWQTTPLSHGSLPGEGVPHSDKPYQEHKPQSFASPPIISEGVSAVNSFNSVNTEDQTPDTGMSTRGDRSVTKLQEKYGSERPLSFDSSVDRRTAYANSQSRSLKSLDSIASNRPGRYSQDRSASGSQHPHRSSGDFTSARSDSYGGYATGSGAIQDTKPSSHHHQTMSHIRSGATSDAQPSGRHRGFQDDRAKIPGDLKRGSTESGYGSLDKDKIRRGNYTGSTSGDSNPVNAIRDKYLVNRPLSTSNGDTSRTSSYGTRAIATPPTSVSDSLARALHSGSESEDSESRAARIARYKEQRRRELAEKYGLGPSSSESESTSRRRYSSRGEEPSPTSERVRKLSNASDRSSNLDASPLSRRYPSKESLSSVTGEVESIHTNGNTSQDNSPATTPRLSRKARRDSNISAETQDFIDALEASRAARRERLRRSEAEEHSDATDRLIARHRRRKSSVDSSSDVFESPHRSGSRDRRHDDYSDSDSVTSSTSVDRPSRRHLRSDRSDIRESRKRQDTLSEQEARDSIRLMIKNINNLLAAATKDDPSDNDEENKLIKLRKEDEKNLDDSDNDVDDSVFDMEDSVESKDSGIESKSPDSGVHNQPESSGNNNNKANRDKRKRHNQAVTMEDIQKASKLKTSKDPAPSQTTEKSKEVDRPRSPRLIEYPSKTSPQELSPRSLKAGGFKIETVTKTELKNDSSMPKPGDQTIVMKRAASPIKDVSKRASWGSREELSKDSLKPVAAKRTEVDSAASPASKVTLRKPEVPKVLQDTTRQRKNSDSSLSTSESLSVSPTRKVRGGSFSQRSSDSEKSSSLQRPKSMPLKDATKATSQSKDQKASTTERGGHSRVSSSPEKKKVSKTMSSPERKPPKKSDPKTSAERKLSSASSTTSSSTKSSQVDKRTSYPPAKTTSPDRKPLTRRQSSPEKKLSTRQPSPEKKVTTRQPSPEKKVSKTAGEKKLTREASTEKKSSRTTSPEKKPSGTSSSEKKLPRTTSPDKRASKTSPTEKKDIRAASPEKRPSTKRTTSPVKKPSVKKDSESTKTTKKSPDSSKTSKDVDNKEVEGKTNGVDKSKKKSTKSELTEKKLEVKEEIIPKKEETKEECVPAIKEPKMPQPPVTIIAPAPDRKPSQAKRIRSRTIEVDVPRRFGPPDPKKEALSTKDDELFAMMQMRAQQIREEEEKEGKVEESGEEEDRSFSEERPEDVIKVSIKDRMQSFKGKESKPTLVDYSKLPVSPTPKRTTKMLAPPENRPEPVNVKQNGEEMKSGDEEPEEQDQLAGLSLSEKMKMFTQMSAIRKQAQEEEEKRAKSKSSSRFHRTRGRERFQTQPVTPEELNSASSLAKEMAAQAEQKEEKKESDEEIAREIKKEEMEEAMNTQDRIREEIRLAKLREKIEEEPSEESDDTSSRLPSMAEEEEPPPDIAEDEYTKLTLSEKMKLFKEKSTAPTKPPPKVEPPKRKRRSESRFRTQPITVDEVKKAAVSPLAKSFSRPPSVEVLGALPIAQQVSMVYGDSTSPPHPATMNGKSVSSTRRSSTSTVKEETKETTAPTKPLPKKEVEVKPKSYKETVKQQKNLMAMLASEIKGSSKADEDEVEHPKSEAVDESIKMARLGLDVTSPTEEKKPVIESVETKPVEQTRTAPVASSRKIDNIPQKAPPSPQTRHSLSQKQGTKETPSSPKKQLSSPEKKLTKPQPHPRSPQSIRRNGTSKTTKDAAPPSPVPPPRKSKIGSPASVRRQDSHDGDISSGAEDGKRIVNGAAKGSSSEHATPQRENKADQKGDEWSSESESEVRQRVSPVTEEHVALIKKKQSKKNGTAEKRDRNKTQPIPAAFEEAQQKPVTPKRLTVQSLRAQNPDRFKTQPVTPDELKQIRQMMDPVQTTSSIKDRLKALQKNGEEGWKKRISKYEDSPQSCLKERLNLLNHNSKYQKDNEIDDLPGNQGSISERLQALKEDGTTWRKRIEDKDIDNFTVSGKLKQAGKVSSDEAETKPQTKLRRAGSNRKPRPGSFRITIKRTDSDASINSDSQSSKQENGTEVMSSGLTTTTTESEDSEPDYRIIRKTVTVMKPDDEGFTDFFASTSKFMEESMTSSSTPTTSKSVTTKKTEKKDTLKLTVSDFDALTEGTGHSLGLASAHRRSLRPQRRTRPSANPLKAMKNRANIVSEYTEERIELAEVPETKKSKSESRKENASKAARAGLASKEDIAQGKTKLSTVKDVREMGGNLSELLPYKDLMLIHVKGRRFVQVRLVEPKMTSLNSGDCFILVTPNEIFLWIGEFANVIEKSKATEIAQHIQQKRDLGCKAPSVTEIQETKQKTSHSRGWKRFSELLGGETKYKDVGAPDEDEMHEIYITETNMVYRVEGDSLEPYEAYWASPGKFNMLDTNEVFVFDFGSEIYIWRGKAASKRKRKAAAQLAQLLWERGFDYSDYDVNPINPQDKENMVKNERPDWTLVGKATQYMETILFRHKFIDWPRETDSSKKNGQEENQKTEQVPELVPFDAKLMIQPSHEKPHLILEGTNLGRGDGLDTSNDNEREIPAFFNKIDRKGQKINTLSVVVWHVLEYEHSIVPEESFGQFHEGDTYVIRWLYNVENTGMKSLKGTASKWGGTQGRERCAYFFWQGQQSTINEKGASALMTVELDEERGPQKQVVQGKEPAAFFQLFKGRMVVHIGKREDEETNTTGPYRLYCVRGEHTKETSLMEVPVKMRSLRSRTSFVLLNLSGVHNKKVSLHLWHGIKVSKATKECAQHAAAALKEHLPLEAGVSTECSVTLEEMEEGKESAAFTKALGKDRKTYDSAISDPLKYEYTPRLFQLTSGSGVFVSNEILYPARSTEYPSPYPFLQSDLYSVDQPALFALDNHYEIYLWQGWWPADHESASGTTKTGSAKIRWDIDRKLAMETVMAYCKEKRAKNPPKAYLVYAGLEPLTFTNLFPFWEVREDVMKLNRESGKRSDKAVLVKDVLAKLTKATYTMEEISKRPLPEGVDPLKLETYLSDQEFKSVLKMTKDEFYKLPMWKQKNLKKTNGLF